MHLTLFNRARRRWRQAAVTMWAWIGLAIGLANAQTLTLLHPKESSFSTTGPFVNVLGRTEAGNRVTVGGVDAPVYTTGVFVRDRVPLQPGANTVRVEVTNRDGQRREHTLTVQRDPVVAAASITPSAPTPEVVDVTPYLVVTSTADGASTELVHGLHDVRLGGPNLTELPPGVVLRATGRAGDRVRIELAPQVIAWAPARALAEAPAGAVLPKPFFTNISVAALEPNESSAGRERDGDAVDIPWPANAAYAARSLTTPDGHAALEIDLFGGHHASTWISQKASARWVREVSVEQVGPAHVRVRVALQHRRLWGYSVQRRGGALRLVVHAPPKLAGGWWRSPLSGLVVALEAGHGSAANLGAVGATGTPEKDINRWTTDALRAELESAGARVVDVRVGDENPTQRERAQRATASDAQLFVSVHANAADTSRGYLRVGGTSTLYKHAHSRDAAAAVQRRLLETGLPDFGLISNFNYAPTRLVTQMPALLVEQAFVSNPEEEALLLDPAFRARLARSVRLGLEDFLRAFQTAAHP